MTNADSSEPTVTLSATEARQGRRGRHALWILLVSLALVVMALWGAWAFKAPSLAALDADPASDRAAAEAFAEPTRPVSQDTATPAR